MNEFKPGDLVKLKLTTAEIKRRGPSPFGLFLRYDRYDHHLHHDLGELPEGYATVLIDGKQSEVWLDEIEKVENNE